MAKLVLKLHSKDGNTFTNLFVDVVEGSIRACSGAIWDVEKMCYVEAPFDVVTQTVRKIDTE